ncbi:MAG: hypothetical protein KHX68_12885, partial [Roseburia sp.]|nr:hypothetical protein [Roseburia sp.]
YEQPEAFSKTVVPHVKDGLPNFERDEIPEDFFENRRHIQIVACGTAILLVLEPELDPLMVSPPYFSLVLF